MASTKILDRRSTSYRPANAGTTASAIGAIAVAAIGTIAGVTARVSARGIASRFPEQTFGPPHQDGGHHHVDEHTGRLLEEHLAERIDEPDQQCCDEGAAHRA